MKINSKNVIRGLSAMFIVFSLSNLAYATTMQQNRFSRKIIGNDTVISLYPPPVSLQEIEKFKGKKVNIEERVLKYEVVNKDLKILKVENKDHLQLNVIVKGNDIKLNADELKDKNIFVYGLVTINNGILQIEVTNPQDIFIINSIKKE